MLTISKIKNGGAAAKYFEGQTKRDREIDPATGAVRYFTESGEPPGQWIGARAKALNRQAGQVVQAGELQDLLAGKWHGQSLGQQQKQKPHAAGWDLTFSAPKSVSVVWATADPELRQALESAHEQAVAKVFAYLSHNAGYTRRGKGGTRQERVELVAVAYQHATSRAGDPHLHSHVLVANVAQREDGTWGTIESHPLYEQRLVGGTLYQAELARQLAELGFHVVRSRGRGDTFRIEGVPQALQEHWSQRHQQMAENGATGQSQAAEKAFRKDRPDKGRINRDELFQRWQYEAQTHGWDADHNYDLMNHHSIRPEKAARQLWNDWPRLREKLTRKESTFQDTDLLMALGQAAYGKLGADQVLAMAETLMSDPNAYGLVKLESGVWTTAEHLQRERKMMAHITQMAQAKDGAADADHVARAIGETEQKHGFELSDEQRAAITALTGAARVATLRGAAGTGKTTILQAVRMAYESSGYRVMGAAIANEAAENMQQEAGIESVSVAKILYQLGGPKEKGEALGRMAYDAYREQTPDGENVPEWDELSAGEKARWLQAPLRSPAESPLLDSRTVLVIDEAAMVDTDQMARLVAHAAQAGTKIIFTGDEKQIQSIGAGGGFATARQITSSVGADAELTQVYRQKQDWQREAGIAVSEGKAAQALEEYARHGQLSWHADEAATARAIIDQWWTDRVQHGGSQLMITATNKHTAMLARTAQQRLRDEGVLGPLVLAHYRNKRGVKELYQGDQIRFRKGDKQIGVINGNIGEVVGMDASGRLRVRLLNKDKVVTFDPQKYRTFELAYASTAHKGQGKTVDRAYYWISPHDKRGIGYVSFSRQREDMHTYATVSEFANSELSTLARQLQKSDQKALALDKLNNELNPEH